MFRIMGDCPVTAWSFNYSNLDVILCHMHALKNQRGEGVENHELIIGEGMKNVRLITYVHIL